MTQEMLSILEDLNEEYATASNEAYKAKEVLLDCELCLSKREQELAPDDGWQGSNADKRKAHRDQVLSDDLIYVALSALKLEHEKVSREAQYEIDIYKFELNIREAQVSILTSVHEA